MPFVLLGLLGLSLATAAVSAEVEAPAAGTPLEQMLIEGGWTQQPGPDGSTLFHPPTSADATRTSAAPQPATAPNPPPDIDELLKARGWEIVIDPDGNSLLMPVERAAAKEPPDAGSSEDPASGGTRDVLTPEPDVYEMLRERGWQVEIQSNGDTLLTPAPVAAADKTAPSPQAPHRDVVDTTPPADPFGQFQRALQNKGWRVESTREGALMIYPPSSKEDLETTDRGEPSDRRGYCEGVQVPAVGTGRIDLPVTDETTVVRLATEWLDAFGRPEYTVGRIRQINQVYAVSIVDRTPPYWLRNQLIIRGDSGRIIAVY